MMQRLYTNGPTAKKKNLPNACCILVKTPERVNNSGLNDTSRMIVEALCSCSGDKFGATMCINCSAKINITTPTMAIRMAIRFIRLYPSSHTPLLSPFSRRSATIGKNATPSAPAASVIKKKSGILNAAK
jgi:hypothetical protein